MINTRCCLPTPRLKVELVKLKEYIFTPDSFDGGARSPRSRGRRQPSNNRSTDANNILTLEQQNILLEYTAAQFEVCACTAFWHGTGPSDTFAACSVAPSACRVLLFTQALAQYRHMEDLFFQLCVEDVRCTHCRRPCFAWYAWWVEPNKRIRP